MNEKEIKREIRSWKKLKKKLKTNKGKAMKCKERNDINRKIRELKFQLENLYKSSPEKQKLIEEIYKLEPQFLILKIDLRKHSIEQLQKHIYRVKSGKTRSI